MKSFRPEYYQMCKSSKIQDLWKPDRGDYCFIFHDLPLIIAEVTYPAHNKLGINLLFIGGNGGYKYSFNWLPLQYQLYDCLLSNDKSNRNIWSWSQRFTKFCNSFDPAHEYGTDWEMCWLAFIEHYLWNREWESGEWIEQKG